MGPPRELVSRDAYIDPLSGYGNAAITIASIRGLITGPETTLGQSQGIAQRAIQEGGLSSMGQLIVANCFQVAIQAAAGGHDVYNVIGVRNGAGTAAGAAAAVKAAWEVASGPLSSLSSLYSMVAYHAVDIGSTNGAIAVSSSTATGGVVTTNSFATAGACCLVKWNGSTRSRSTRGRLYLGPILEADINPDGRTLTTGALSKFNTAMSNFRSSLNSAGYPLVVLSRKQNTSYDVTSSAAESTIATQRRRIRT